MGTSVSSVFIEDTTPAILGSDIATSTYKTAKKALETAGYVIPRRDHTQFSLCQNTQFSLCRRGETESGAGFFDIRFDRGDLGEERVIYQGPGEYALPHKHTDGVEISTVLAGDAHVWTWDNERLVWRYSHYDTESGPMTIEASVIHTLVAGENGVIMSRFNGTRTHVWCPDLVIPFSIGKVK